MLTRHVWNPFDDLSYLHRDLDRVFGRYFGESAGRREEAWRPSAEMTTDSEGWRIRLALPGIDPKAVTVDLQGNTLRVSGERPGGGETGSVSSEFTYGAFERTFTLPSNLDADRVRASFTHGMLEIHLPLAESAKPRRIEIGTEQRDIDIKKIA